MVILRRIFSPIWKIWFFIWFAVPFLIMFPLFYFCLVTGRADMTFKLKRIWARIILYGSFLFPVIKYKTHKHKFPKPCVIVANHTSYLDIVLCPLYIDHTAVFMAKAELLRIPMFRYFFVYFDIPVRRHSVTESHRALLEAAKKIDQGLSVIIYPEGTISPEGKPMRFKNGAFKLAIDKQVPIVPVVNLNNWKFLQNGGFFKSYGRPGIPRILVGETIETKGLTEKDLTDIKEKVFNFTKEELEKFNG